ncbi:MAG: NTP transferase domain-containing protein [Spirochaetaceae bacterium]|jgi:mannose-1-phosphate guanylyltransferase|nr:NTP transferase domain-containing protein [Spirochaetaceae bacterium]
MFSDIIILAGGSGARLWPASCVNTPKQFLSVDNEKTLFQAALERAFHLDSAGSILVVTHQDFSSRIARDCRELLDRFDESRRRELREKLFILPEPEAKNTASAITLGCIWLFSRSGHRNSTVLVMPCDHIIGDREAFAADITLASRLASERDGLVFLGIPPNETATAYGYIQSGQEVSFPNSDPCPAGKVFCVQGFKEKPDKESALQYCEAGNYFWNSGIIGFRGEYLMESLRSYTPAVYDPLISLAETVASCGIGSDQGISTITGWGGLDDIYGKIPALSISRAVAEKDGAGYTVIAGFPWADAGNWEVFSRFRQEEIPAADTPSMVAKIDSSDCYVWSDIPVALCGVEDLIVVIKNGQALILRKGHGDKIKELPEHMRNFEAEM